MDLIHKDVPVAGAWSIPAISVVWLLGGGQGLVEG